MSLKSVVFHASFPEPERFGLMKTTKVIFELGIGPCGLNVVNLKAEIRGDFLVVTQQTGKDVFCGMVKGSEIKEFIYKIADIHGRIVTTGE